MTMSQVPDPFDELVSRYVDDDLDTLARARIEDDGEAMERVARLRQLRAELADVDPLPPAQVDAMVAIALDTAAADLPTPTATVVSFRRRQRLLAWVGGAVAAAAVALVAAGVGPRLGGDVPDQVAEPFNEPAAGVARSHTSEDLVPDGDATVSALEAAPGEVDGLGLEPAATFITTESATVAGEVVILDEDELRTYLAAFALPQAGTCDTAPRSSMHGLVTYEGQTVEVIYDALTDTILLADPITCETVWSVNRLP